MERGGDVGTSSAPVSHPPQQLAPGLEQVKRFRPSLRYELVGCALNGHELVGTDAARLRPEDRIFARQGDGFRWYRCLRCDAWFPMLDPVDPAALTPPALDDIALPLRGRPLRDRYVLRVIAVERAFHVLALGALAVAIFLFAANRRYLHHEYTRILAALQGGLGGPVVSAHSGVVSDINRLFALSTAELYLAGAAVAVYTAVLVAEMVGLWRARRWAEYLTLCETGILVPFELYELSGGVSALKVLTLALNLVVVLYLFWAHRLFGVRGGARAEQAERARDTGWAPLRRASLPALLSAPAAETVSPPAPHLHLEREPRTRDAGAPARE